MAVTLTVGAQNAACNAIVDLIDVGTTDLNGDLVFMASGDVAVATLACSNPAFGSAVSGVATAAAISDDTNAAGGTAVAFKLQDRDNAEVFRGTVTISTGSGDLKFPSNTTIGVGDTVQVSSFTVTMPAT